METIEREHSNNTAMIIIFAILVLIGLGVFLAYQQGYFPSTTPIEEKKTEINIQMPAPAPQAPAAPAAPAAPSAPPPAPAAPSNP